MDPDVLSLQQSQENGGGSSPTPFVVAALIILIVALLAAATYVLVKKFKLLERVRKVEEMPDQGQISANLLPVEP